MYILLIGCTGFLGKSIIRYLFAHTKHKVFIAIRPKNNQTIHQRLHAILNEFNINDQCSRITPIHVIYDKERNIVIDSKDKLLIQKKTNVIINALADVKFNRPIRKAVLNNTVTALRWMNLLHTCRHPKQYIYVSSAFVNFHLLDSGSIKERIYEKNMSEKNLKNILNGDQTDIKPYANSYLYSKQLAEILLFNQKRNISLFIFRPSAIIPAAKYPYTGYGTMQTLNYILFGIATGLIPCWNISVDDVFKYNVNLIPVDVAAKDCVKCLKNKESFSIRHSCLTGNNPYHMSYLSFYLITLKAYQYYKKKPITIRQHTYIPYYPFYVNDNTYICILMLIIQYIINRYQHCDAFLKTIKMSYKLTTSLNGYLPYFVTKKIVFHRANKDKWFYKNFHQEKIYEQFIQHLETIIKNDAGLMRMLK